MARAAEGFEHTLLSSCMQWVGRYTSEKLRTLSLLNEYTGENRDRFTSRYRTCENVAASAHSAADQHRLSSELVVDLGQRAECMRRRLCVRDSKSSAVCSNGVHPSTYWDKRVVWRKRTSGALAMNEQLSRPAINEVLLNLLNHTRVCGLEVVIQILRLEGRQKSEIIPLQYCGKRRK
jgi:hypothetical protein